MGWWMDVWPSWHSYIKLKFVTLTLKQFIAPIFTIFTSVANPTLKNIHFSLFDHWFSLIFSDFLLNHFGIFGSQALCLSDPGF